MDILLLAQSAQSRSGQAAIERGVCQLCKRGELQRILHRIVQIASSVIIQQMWPPTVRRPGYLHPLRSPRSAATTTQTSSPPTSPRTLAAPSSHLPLSHRLNHLIPASQFPIVVLDCLRARIISPSPILSLPYSSLAYPTTSSTNEIRLLKYLPSKSSRDHRLAHGEIKHN